MLLNFRAQTSLPSLLPLVHNSSRLCLSACLPRVISLQASVYNLLIPKPVALLSTPKRKTSFLNVPKNS